MTIRIRVTDRDGNTASHTIGTGGPLMFALRDEAGLPVEGACGGSATCGTCHVIIAKHWIERLGAPNDYENALLDMLQHNQGSASRLACQLDVTDALEGLELTLAPEE